MVFAQNPEVEILIKATDETRKGLDSAQKRIRGLGQQGGLSFTALATGATAAVGAISALGAGVAALTRGYADNVLEIQRVSLTTGATVEAVDKMTHVFSRFKLGAEDVRDVFNELSIKLVDARDPASDVAQAFAALGLNTAQLEALSPDQVFLRVSDALNQVANGAERAWIADSIFGGDMAQKTLPIMAMGSAAIQKLGEDYAATGALITSENVKMTEEFDAAWNRMQTVLDSVSKRLAITLLPEVTRVIEMIELAFDRFSGAAEYTFGDALNDTINATLITNINLFLTVLEALLNGARGFFHDAVKGGLDGVVNMANGIIDFINNSLIRPLLTSPILGGAANALGLQEIGRATAPDIAGSETLKPIVIGRAQPLGISGEEFNRREFARGLITRGTLAGGGGLEEMYTSRTRPTPATAPTSPGASLGRGTASAGTGRAARHPEEAAIRNAERYVPLNSEDGQQQGQAYRQLAERARAAGLTSLASDLEYKARSAEVRQQRSNAATAKRNAERISGASSRSTPNISSRSGGGFSGGGGGGTIRTGDKIEVNFNIQGSILSDLELTRVITELMTQQFIDLGLLQDRVMS